MGEASANRHEGFGFIKVNTDGSYKSSVDKFYSEEKLKAIAEAAHAQPEI
jgi:aspartyl-tRNA synthetase